ncbi:E3 ubiquitin-protein ligase Topors isoform X2 [Drosophila kikkawai]|uniref:RING-type E3 ubiquitin transferase n=1 Tax=Drosophila kikkawai TaxID=30033 RepID=A0ABM4GAT7_DROKI
MAEEVPPDADAAASSFAEDVGASVIVEAGATSGTLTLPASAMKFADLTESGSESGDNEAGSGSGSGDPGTSAAASGGRSSPPPNCAICLSRCHRKCFTDSCMHQFCFKCLCEWSKIKAECPLCKQRFKTIIHNVRTLDDYDRYPVQTSSPSQPDHPAMRFHIVRRPRFMPLVQNQAVMTNDIEGGIGAGSGAAGVAGGVLAAEEVLPAVEASGGRHTYNRFEPYRWELMNFYRHDTDAATAGSSSLIQLWRRYVYDRKLYALPVSDSLTGHFREWSARFYRNNPAQMHRLMPWIQRDIVCLLRNAAHSVGTVMQLMHDILPMTNILGPTFRRRLSPYLGDRTSHFIHELFNFARSPFDMIGYDHVVQYSARVAEEVEVDLLDMVETQSSNESDLHLEVGDGVDGDVANAEASNEWSTANGGGGGGSGAGGRPSTSVIVTNPSATHSFSVTMASDGSELPGISIRRAATTSNVGSQTVAINLSMRRPAPAGGGEAAGAEIIEIDDGDAAANAEVAAINDGSNPSRRHAGATLPVSAHIELQSSSSSSSGEEDECVFVLELKPPHLRTPEQVSLGSDSDSDVVFVNEQNETPAAPSAAAGNPEDQAGIDQATTDQSSRPFLYMGPSTSAAATRGKNWKLMMAEVRRQDQMRSTRSTRSKRSRQRRSTIPARCATESTTDSSSSFGWTTSSDEESSTDSSSFNPSAKKKARKTVATRKGSGKSPRSKGKALKRTKRQAAEAEREEGTPAEPAVEEQAEKEQPQMQTQPEQQQQSSSDSCSSCADESAGESSESSEPHFPERNKSNTSSDDSDDDSTENLQLSALRATLKAEATLEDRKPLKLELQMPDEDDNGDDDEEEQQQQSQQPKEEEQKQEQQQEPTEEEEAQHPTPPEDTETPGCSAPKRRRSCSNHSNLSSQSASLASSSTTATTSSGPLSSFNWRAASYGSDPLMREALPLEDEDDMAPSLIDVALNFLRHERTGNYALEEAAEEAVVETAEDTATADEDEEEDEDEEAEENEDDDEEEEEEQGNAVEERDLAENINDNHNDDEDEDVGVVLCFKNSNVPTSMDIVTCREVLAVNV